MLVIAHGLAGRPDLPIPAELFGAAAALVLAVSFAALASRWSRPRLESWPERPLLRLPRAVDVLAGAAGVAAFAFVVWAGLAGQPTAPRNPAPAAIYVAFWVGIPMLTLVFGDVFRLLSPWRALGRAGGWLAGRLGASGDPLTYPERLGRWPAAAGIVGFALVELAWGRGDDPQALAILALAYAAVQLVGMSLYGVEPWSRNADAFGVYFGLFASLAPLARRADGTVVLRPPVVGATRLRVVPGTIALVIAAIAATTFDGSKEGPLFADIAKRLQDFFVSLGATKAQGLEFAFAIGILGACGLVAAIFAAGLAGMPRAPDGGPKAARFVHALVPIAAAYVVAHYVSLVVFRGQELYALVSDPVGDGSDWFGTARRTVDYGAVGANAFWYVQVGALVIGHVAALVLAHDRALAVYGSARDATRSQVAMLVVMIVFTCLGLWLLSVANA